MSDIERQVNGSISRLNIVLGRIDDPEAKNQLNQVKRNLRVISDIASTGSVHGEDER